MNEAIAYTAHIFIEMGRKVVLDEAMYPLLRLLSLSCRGEHEVACKIV